MKKGTELATVDINQKFLMGELNGDEIWVLEVPSKKRSKK